jgi:hypothetical protein
MTLRSRGRNKEKRNHETHKTHEREKSVAKKTLATRI